MRLSKKIAAVALAAVMSVSLLTACGDNDAPSSSNPGSSSSSSSSSSADSSSSSGSASDSSSSSSSSGSSSNSSTGDKEENVAYKDSRTARFYQKLGTSYTLGARVDITTNGENQQGESYHERDQFDMLVVTNGSRTYQQTTVLFDGVTENQPQTQILLIDRIMKKQCVLIPSEDEDLKDQGKLGYYISETISGTSTDVTPNKGLKFKKETKGNYYIETQSWAVPADDGKGKMVLAYYYKGNNIVPEYVEVEQSLGSEGTSTGRMTFTRVENKADAEKLDFETILEKYIPYKPGTVQAMNPSIAGLNIG